MKAMRDLPVDFPVEPSTDCGSDDWCHCCGRGLNPATAYWVLVVDGGASYANAADAELWEGDKGNCGMFPVGPECARHFDGWAVQLPSAGEVTR